MDRKIVTEIRRALTARPFLFACLFIAGLLIVLTVGDLEEIFRTEKLQDFLRHQQLFLGLREKSELAMALPILCALPATTSFIDDVNGGFIKFYLIRCGRKPYIGGKLFACALSGGLVPVIGAAVCFTLLWLLVTPMEKALAAGETAPFYLQDIAKFMLVLFLNGALWAVIGMTVASVTMSRYMAYASPFILYYILVILHERYLPKLYVIYPREWLYPQHVTEWGGFAIFLLLTEIIAIVGMWFYFYVGRKIHGRI